MLTTHNPKVLWSNSIKGLGRRFTSDYVCCEGECSGIRSALQARFTGPYTIERNAKCPFHLPVLSGVPDCEVYLDNVVVYSNSWKDHLAKLDVMYGHLADASLPLNLAKCEFANAVVTYIGKCVGQSQVWPVEAKVCGIVEFPTPTNKRCDVF